MSQFSGPQHKGAMKVRRDTKRVRNEQTPPERRRAARREEGK